MRKERTEPRNGAEPPWGLPQAQEHLLGDVVPDLVAPCESTSEGVHHGAMSLHEDDERVTASLVEERRPEHLIRLFDEPNPIERRNDLTG